MTPVSLPPREALSDDVVAVLDRSVGLAASTGAARVRAGHILLALLKKDQGFIDTFVRNRFGGIRATSLADALRDTLELQADLAGDEPGDFPDEGLPRAEDLDRIALATID